MQIMVVTVTAHHEEPLNRDQTASLLRRIGGEVEHDHETGELVLRWYVTGDRVLGAMGSVPRIAMLALMDAFGHEPEIMSVSVSLPERH